jgi:hypothetical protein
MPHPDSKKLAWLFGAALAMTTATVASIASTQPDPAQAPADSTASPALRNTLDSCMGFWDAETHMSKAEWRAACRRTVNGTDMGMEGLDGKGYRGGAKGSRR